MLVHPRREAMENCGGRTGRLGGALFGAGLLPVPQIEPDQVAPNSLTTGQQWSDLHLDDCDMYISEK